MIDRLTANIRISRKLSIAPAVAIVLLSLMAPLALSALNDQSKLLEAATTTGAAPLRDKAYCGAPPETGGSSADIFDTV